MIDKDNTKDFPWLHLRYDEIDLYDHAAYGVFKDRYIALARERRVLNQRVRLKHTMMYDIHTCRLKALPDQDPENLYEGTIWNDKLYVFARSRPIKHLSFSSTTSASASTTSTTSTWKESLTILEPDNMFNRRRPSIMGGRNYPRAVIPMKNSIYIVGLHDVLYCYDPMADKLTKISKIPEGVINYTVSTVADQIYFLGGLKKQIKNGKRQSYYDGTNTVCVFDTSIQTWDTSSVPPLPLPVVDCASTTIFNRWIVVTGGYNRYHRQSGKIYVLDTLSQQWRESRIQLLSPCAGHQCLTIGSQIVCIGGNDIAHPMQAIDISHIIPEWKYERIKHFILLRKLMEEGRASLIIEKEINVKDTKTVYSSSNEVTAKQKMLKCVSLNVSFLTKRKSKTTPKKNCIDQKKMIPMLFISLNWDTFRNVLSFL